MGLVNHRRINDVVYTLSELSNECGLRKKLGNTLQGDCYDTLQLSLKRQTWEDRAKENQGKINLTANKTIIKDI